MEVSGTIALASGFLLEEETAMTDDREKWDGTKPKPAEPEHDEKDRREKKAGDQERVFDGPSTDSEVAKHDGP